METLYPVGLFYRFLSDFIGDMVLETGLPTDKVGDV